MKRSYRGDRSMAMKKISCIIPCYNEEAALPYFLREIRKVADQMSATDPVLFEILFVNDGSKDRTLEILREAAKEDARVRYISFSRNFGKEAAMYAGFKNVTGDYAAVMDADMQDPPSLLPEMYRALQSGEYDSVATCRADRKGEPPIRSFFARCFYKIINQISDADIVDGARDFRLMKREMVDAIVTMGEYNRFSKGIFGWISDKMAALSECGACRRRNKVVVLETVQVLSTGYHCVFDSPAGDCIGRWNSHLPCCIPNGHWNYCEDAAVGRPGRRVAVSGLHDYVYEWNSAFVHWDPGTIFGKDVLRNKASSHLPCCGDE